MLQAVDRPRLVLLGDAGSLDLAAHLRSAGSTLLDLEAPPAATSPGLAAQYGYCQLSARTGNVGSLRALRQVIEVALTGHLPAHWIWTRKDGRFVDGLRSRVEPAGVASAKELAFLRTAHHVALASCLTQSDEVILCVSGAPCYVDAEDGAAYPFAPDQGVELPAGAKLKADEPDLAALDRDFLALHELLTGLNPRLLLRLAMMPMPVSPQDKAEDFSAQLPALRRQSDLRVLMAHWQATLPRVGYLPLWELCTGDLARSGHFSPLTAALTPEGGRLAARLCIGDTPEVASPVTAAETAADMARSDVEDRKARRAKKRALRAEREAKPQSVVCEEELLEAFSR